MTHLAARTTCSLLLCISVCAGAVCATLSSSTASDSLTGEPEFSGTLTKRVNGRHLRVHVFAKGKRLRLEYTSAIRTELGFVAIQIIRPDLAEVWSVLPQQKELLITPLAEDVLPIRGELVGETGRTALGLAVIANRSTRLFDVKTERSGSLERFYEWVDVETGIVMKLASQDRDWSIEYERVRFSPQPTLYFEEPPGYRKRPSLANQKLDK